MSETDEYPDFTAFIEDMLEAFRDFGSGRGYYFLGFKSDWALD